MPSVNYIEFKNGTSLYYDNFHAYGGRWKEVHEKYSAWDINRTENNEVALFLALFKYVNEHGDRLGNFASLKRNYSGVLKKVFDELIPKYRDRIVGDQSAIINSKEVLDKYENPHTRIGVLYVLSHVNIDPNFNLTALGLRFLQTGMTIGGQATMADLSQVSNSRNDLYFEKVPGLGWEYGSKDLVELPGGVAAGIALGVEKAGLGRTAPKGPIKTIEVNQFSLKEQFPGSLNEITLAAQSIADGFVESDYFSYSMMADRAQTYWSGLPGVAETYDQLCHNTRLLYESVKQKLTDYINELIIRFKTDTQYAIEFSMSLIAGILKIVLKQVIGNAVPFIGNAITFVEKTGLAITNIISCIDMFYAALKVNLTKGHPELISKNLISYRLHNAMEYAAAATTAAVMGVGDVSFPGLGAILGAISNGCIWIYSVIMQYYESEKIKVFLLDAREKWQQYSDLAECPSIEEIEVQTEYIKDPNKFAEWFQKGCDASPLIPSLVLRSGYCGNYMTWCQLVTDTYSLVRQEVFEDGQNYITHLKKDALRIIRDSPIKIIPSYLDDRHKASTVGMVDLINGKNESHVLDTINFTFGNPMINSPTAS